MNPRKFLLWPVSLVVVTATLSAAEIVKSSTIHSQPCALLSTKQVELAVTKLGGHMSPVTFFRDSGKPVQP